MSFQVYPNTGGNGDVDGPASSVDNAVAVFDGTTGMIIKDGSSSNALGNRFVESFTTTATAAGTTTLTVSSTPIQEFTGATTQTVVLPVVTTLPKTGFSFYIVNNSSGALTVNSSGGNLVQSLAADSAAMITCILLTGTTASSWDSAYIIAGGGIGGSTGATDNAVLRADGTGGSTVQTSSVVIADTTGNISGTQQVTFNGTTSGTTGLKATAIAGATTVTLPAATDTLVGKATTDTFTNKTFDTAGTGNSLSINSVAVTANTGTGAVVRETSPTLVTPALGTPSALVGTNITGTASGLTAGNVTTNANLTGVITSVGNATSIASQTGTGSTFVVQGSPTLTTPNIGTPSAGTLTSCTGLPISTGVSGLGTGVATALAVNVGSAGAPVVNGGALGTPSSGTATNLSGTASGLTAGNVTTNANLTGVITSIGNATSIASQTGTGSTFVVQNTPTLITPILGTPTSGTLTNCTGLPQAGVVGLTTADSPEFAGINLGAASDTTLTRVSAGVMAVEGSTVLTAATGQPLDSDLTTIAGLTATTDNFLQAKSSAWASRTIAQVLADLQGTGLLDAYAGFRNLPQNSQSVDYTCVAADSGKHIYQTGATKTVTIPANGSVAFPLGTAITFICSNASGCTIAITTDTLRWADGGGTGSRTLAQYGMATAVKVATTEWLINGTGLT